MFASYLHFVDRFFFFMPLIIFNGGGPYSITTVHTYIHPVSPIRLSIRNKNGFRSISFEKISVWIQILYTGIYYKM